MNKPIKPNSFAYTSPYGGCWLEHFYSQYAENLFGKKVIKEVDFRQLLDTHGLWPALMIMGNFIVERQAITALCRERGINTIHSEDGFFPHYSTMHADPLGFCWESSLTSMVFRHCMPQQREAMQCKRQEWLDFASQELPPAIQKPFVLWPVQLVGDRVNRWDLNVTEWTGLISHFRQCLPAEHQLVIKDHPRSKEKDNVGLDDLTRSLPNTVLIPRTTHLKTLLSHCSAVAGANSTVLMEARLMFHKPTYVYARGWFTNHYELFTPVYRLFPPRTLNRLDWIDDNRRLRTDRLDDYTDWFLYQLCARQISREEAAHDSEAFLRRVDQLSYSSFVKYGEDIFSGGK